jgi:nitric oxide dioxygenase
VVGKYLLEAISEVVGKDIFSGALYEAWYVGYWALAHLFIEREASLYRKAGWVGWKEFTVAKRIVEADGITSFYLAPKDGTHLNAYRPGQYVSVQLFVKELGCYQSRQCVSFILFIDTFP